MAIRAWCAEQDWKRERAVVFLDPYGLQVEWTTIQTLGDTRGVDLWYLFPLNMARLLTRDGIIDEAWRKRLDLLFGTHDWKARFYKPRIKEDLFGTTETIERDATVENIKEFIEERLRTCFHAVAKGLVLKNSRSSPLYLLCFAAANEKGAPTALRIAQSILGD
jgi:three-Cys-motif partner protein